MEDRTTPLYLLYDSEPQQALLAGGTDPKEVVLSVFPDTQPGTWMRTRCINGDMFESPCGRYFMTEATA